MKVIVSIYGAKTGSDGIEAIWNDWLTKVTMAAESTIGKSKRPKMFRSFWDKELDALIKSRRALSKRNEDERTE